LRLTDEVLNEKGLRAALRVLDAPGTGVVHLDLGEVRLPTAEGLGLLVSLNRALCDRGSRLAVVNVRPQVYEVFALTRLTDVLDVRPA
jgi:anti-anti-sigma factor